MNNNQNNSPKEEWIVPSLKAFNKTDFIKSGAAVQEAESGICYKMGS
jgi:hypothetical protein